MRVNEHQAQLHSVEQNELIDLAELHQQYPDELPFLLHSADLTSQRNRYSLLLARSAAEPIIAYAKPGKTAAASVDKHAVQQGFLQRLKLAYAAESVPASVSQLPFIGGWFVYLGYELAAEIEPVLELPQDQHPIAAAWRCDAAVLVDHKRQTSVLLAESAARLRQLRSWVETMSACADNRQTMAARMSWPTSQANGPQNRHPHWQVDCDDGQQFCAGVERIKQWIAAGDVFQVNLSRAWCAQAMGVDVDAASSQRMVMSLYRRLCAHNPAPFAGLAKMFGGTLISASPERLLAVNKRQLATRPIAGTRPRGADHEQDQRLIRELLDNPKERAEHIMLIDLERNDLGRVCDAGTVRVDELMVSETYASVHHIVSNVVGQLRADLTPVDAIAAIFPGGTITGCPKVRCMQIIAALEQQPRRFYTGSMGYLSRHGNMDLNILIRSLWCQDNVINWRCGSGIVADSQPAAELAETEAKAAGILRCLSDLH